MDVLADTYHGLAGNPNVSTAGGFSIVYDGTPPEAAFMPLFGEPVNEPFLVRVGFSEEVTGFDSSSDLSVINGAAGTPVRPSTLKTIT